MQNTIVFGSGNNLAASTSSQSEPPRTSLHEATSILPHKPNCLVPTNEIPVRLSWNYQRHHQISPYPRSSSRRRRNQPGIGIQWNLKTTAASRIASLESTRSQKQLIDETLGTISLDGQKPSLCLLRIQRKLSECHLTMENDLIKHCLMQAMPISTRSSLSAHLDLPPDKFAKLADTYTASRRTLFRKTARLRYTAILVIVVSTPAAAKAKK